LGFRDNAAVDDQKLTLKIYFSFFLGRKLKLKFYFITVKCPSKVIVKD